MSGCTGTNTIWFFGGVLPGIAILPTALIKAFLPEHLDRYRRIVFLVLASLVTVNGGFWLLWLSAFTTPTNIIPFLLCVATIALMIARLSKMPTIEGFLTGAIICLATFQGFKV